MKSPNNDRYSDDAIPVRIKVKKTQDPAPRPIRTGRPAVPPPISGVKNAQTSIRTNAPAAKPQAGKPTAKPASPAAGRPKTAGPSAGKPQAAPAVPKPKTQPASPKPKTVPESAKQTAGHRGLGIGRILGRCLLVLLTTVFLLAYAVYMTGYTLANGPSETLRDQLVMMALQASATKWAPGLFLPEKTVEEIYTRSQEVHEEKIVIDDVKPDDPDDPDDPGVPKKDEWEDAVDGVLYKEIRQSGFKAYLVLVRDPSRVFVGTSSDDFPSATEGMRIWDAAKRYDALIAINAGEFSDPGGTGSGGQPVGLTFSRGACVWSDSHTRNTFIGFDANDRLIVAEGMKRETADALGIRDSVMFQKNNVLITNDGRNVTTYRRDGDAGTAQRTAIGQRQDGTVILVVTDGRTASSIGATYNDIIELMLSEGAVTAAMLDGGSSSLLYYQNYDKVLGIDRSTLDQYQQKGIVNKYKAFTTPRRLPTFFMVTKGGASS